MQHGGMDRRRRLSNYLLASVLPFTRHCWMGVGCWSWAASSGGSKRGRGHVVSEGMVELLDLGWRSDASAVIVLESA